MFFDGRVSFVVAASVAGMMFQHGVRDVAVRNDLYRTVVVP